MEEKWCKLHYDVLAAVKIEGEDGGEISLSPSDKLVYSYVKERVEYFVKEKKGEYYANHVTIGQACGIHPKTVGKSVRKLVEAGVFVVEEKRRQGWSSTSYRVVKPLKVLEGFPPVFDGKEKEEKPIKTSPPVVDVELDGPF